MSEGKLLPCPWCGATAKSYIAFPQSDTPWHIDVSHEATCPLVSLDSACYSTESDLRREWNTRAQPSTDNAENEAKARELLAVECVADGTPIPPQLFTLPLDEMGELRWSNWTLVQGMISALLFGIVLARIMS